jgi:AraC-like DNA-binding protein
MEIVFDLLKAELYVHYYDQSHFCREFQRMTGHPPQKFIRDVPNEFGRRLVRRQVVSA